MNKIESWYWQYGVQRGNDQNDPDRALRKISVGGWLDQVAHLADRVETIRRSFDTKSTIALWGPSQTGKSTLLSRYLDGDKPDGSDSALTWDASTPIRFSPDSTVGANMEMLYPSTIVFNPYNFGSDASGVATRYTLASDADAEIDRKYPIEYRFVSRVQILHAIALGYLTECNPVGDNINYRQDELIQRLSEGATGTSAPPDPAAYEILRDLADVIELLRAKDRFANLFRRGDWERKVRPAIVSAPHLLADQTKAWGFVFELLWDGAGKLTEFFNKIEALGARLSKEWSGATKILLSPAVAGLLLDIGTLERIFGGTDNFRTPDKATLEKLEKIEVSRDSANGAVCVKIGRAPSGAPIAGEAFGLFQALCAEMVVPLRREALEGSETKRPMLSLLKKHSLLDLPGLGRKNSGLTGQTSGDDRKNPLSLTDLDFYKYVLKVGRTQGIVDGHVASFAVDSFVVLNNANDPYPAKSGLISAGIGNWLRSFDPGWSRGKPAPLPVFLDLTFFAKAVNDAHINGLTPPFAEYATRSIDTQDFAQGSTCRWFVTTYPFFPPGKIIAEAKANARDLADKISAFEPFSGPTGLSHGDIEAVFGEDGGTGRMLVEIANSVNPDSRRARCAQLLKADIAKLRSELERQMPSTEEVGLDARRASLRETYEAIQEEVRRIEDKGDPLDYASLSLFLRNLFAAPRDIFEPVPRNVALNANEREAWLKRQVKLWFDDAEKRVEDDARVDSVKQRELLATLRDNIRTGDGNGDLGEFLKRNLGRITDVPTGVAARFPFSVAFGNVLRTGRWERVSPTSPGESDSTYLASLVKGMADNSREREASPHWKTVIEPILKRIDYLADNALAGARPPQPGDDELGKILESINACHA